MKQTNSSTWNLLFVHTLETNKNVNWVLRCPRRLSAHSWIEFHAKFFPCPLIHPFNQKEQRSYFNGLVLVSPLFEIRSCFMKLRDISHSTKETQTHALNVTVRISMWAWKHNINFSSVLLRVRAFGFVAGSVAVRRT